MSSKCFLSLLVLLLCLGSIGQGQDVIPATDDDLVTVDKRKRLPLGLGGW